MKKSMKRTLSLLLALTMVLSLGLPAYAVGAPAEDAVVIADEEPVELPAEEPVEEPIEEPVEKPVTLPIGAGKKIGFTEEEEIVSEDLIVDIVSEESVVEEEAAPAKDFSYSESATGFSVEVSAPAGALPLGTEMVVDRLVDLSSVQNAVDRAENLNGSVQLAADISFWLNGEEIEPAEGTKLFVRMSAPEIEGIADPIVIHVPDGENAVPEIVEQMSSGDIAMANSVEFETSSFSVYAVIGGDDATNPRLKVIFHDAQNNETLIYVKKADTENDEAYAKVLYDPGVGTLPENQIFIGWTNKNPYTLADKDNAMDIAAIREYVKTQINWSTITEESEPLNFYAMLLKSITITYLGDGDVALGSDNEMVLPETESISYTVNMSYIPVDTVHNFEGWLASKGSSFIAEHTEGRRYQNGDVITVSGNVVFSVDAPEGHWLVFKENGKGATYNAPQFVKSGEVTERPRPDNQMKRLGYTFGGWYKDEACTDGNEFIFGNELTDKTFIYAKWIANDTADYTVIIWKQKPVGDGYDFSESIRLNGSVGTTINTVNEQGSGNNRYARINGKNYTGNMTGGQNYTGFHLNSFDSNVTIAAEGSSVLHVYYDRNVYQLKFQVYDYTYSATTSNSGTQYGLVDGEYVELSRHGWSGSYYWTYGDTFFSEGTRYTGTRYTRSSASWQTVKTIEARYQQPIGNQFPIVGDNGKSYNGQRWSPQNGTTYNNVLVYIDVMPAESVTFRADNDTPSTRYMEFYVEALPGQTVARTWNGKSFVKHGETIDARYNFFTESEDFVELTGYNKYGSDPSFNNGRADVSAGDTIRLYYTRKIYDINYMDGVYVNGDNKPVSGEVSRGQLSTVGNIQYGSDLTSRNKGGSDYYEPSYDGFVLEGWYVDEACTHPFTFSTMPDGGITVYAKWRQIQYRVFLHPEAETDPTLDWGDKTQQMNFRISYGETVSLPTGLRGQYEMVGWYKDKGYTQAFDADIALTGDVVKTDYDKSKDFTDPMDIWGNGATTNSDATGYNGGDRFWITKKLDLYARWRKVIQGADGIGVYYDLNGGSGTVVDPTLYKDTAKAIAQGAATAPDGYRFLYWVVQSFDKTNKKFVDTDIHVYPGKDYEVLLDNAEVTNVEYDPNDSSKIKSATYTIHLRAEYGLLDAPIDTYIKFHANNGTSETETHKNLKINQAIIIPSQQTFTNGEIVEGSRDAVTPSGMTNNGLAFLGWAKIDMEGDPSNPTPAKDPATLTENDLFLRWIEAGNDETTGHFEAKDENDAWVVVTQVAADEFTPYQDLYAVWGQCFYVYHSGDNTVERFLLSTSVTFDLTKLVDTSKYLYGGYYKGYEGKSTDFSVDTMNWKQADAFNATVAGSETVVSLTHVKAKDTGSNVKPYTLENIEDITWGSTEADAAYTDPAHQLSPVAGSVYYIKEVPIGSYLQPKLRYTYTGSGKIGTSWLFTNTDDTNYSDVGFMITATDAAKPEKVIGDKATSVTITPSTLPEKAVTFYVGTAPEGTGSKTELFANSALMSYKKVYNNPNVYDESDSRYVGEDPINILTDGASVYMFWVTPDNMIVTSQAVRTYNGIATTGMQTVKDTQNSTISVYPAS